MAKYLLLKHYRGAPESVNNVPMDQWTPQEVDDHMKYMQDFAAKLEKTGEFVDGQALAPEAHSSDTTGKDDHRPPTGPSRRRRISSPGGW